MKPDTEWYETQIQELEQRDDWPGLLEMALKILDDRPSRGQEARAPGLFECAADEILKAPAVLIESAETLDRLLGLLNRACGYDSIDPDRLGNLMRRAEITAGLSAFHRGNIEEADDWLRRAASSRPGSVAASNPGEGLLDDLRELKSLAKRNFPVIHSVLRRYEEAFPSPAFYEASRAVLSRLSLGRQPLVLQRPGQIGVLVVLARPTLGEQFGRMSRLTVVTRRARWKKTNSIRFSPQLTAQVRQRRPAERLQLEAVAQQALEAAAGIVGATDVQAVWDLDLPEETVTGPSLGLALALGIVSAWRRLRVVPATAATGALNVAGDVTEVGGLDAKARAALWQGARLILFPACNSEGEAIGAQTRAMLDKAGAALYPVSTLGAACELAIPGGTRWAAPDEGAGLRRHGALAAGVLAAGISGTLWLASGQRRGGEASGTGAARPILRSRYYVADGDFVLDALARGEYRKVFHFDRDPLLLDNDTLRFARRIRSNYFHPVEEFARLNGDYIGSTTPAVFRDKFPGIRLFRKPTGDFRLFGEVRRKQYRLPAGEDPAFYLEPDPPDTPAGMSPTTVHRKALPAVAASPPLRRDPLTRDLIRANPGTWDLADFGLHMGVPPPCVLEPTPEDLEWLRIRPLKLLFLDIENVGATPALNLAYATREILPPPRETLAVRLTREAEDRLGKAPLLTHRFPYETLKPGEHILVMLAVGLGGIGEDDIDALPEGTTAQRQYGFYYDLSHPLAPREEPYRRSYLFGPQVRIDEVSYTDAGGRSYREPERRLAEQRIQVSNVVGSGSCPFVYCQDRDTGAWSNLGSVLARFRGAGSFGHDRRLIPLRFGRIELRELEPEISYIDRAELEVEDAGGDTRRLVPLDARLRASDGSCLVLRPGDRADLRFDGGEKTWRRRVLHVWGHFVPLEQGTTPPVADLSRSARNAPNAASRR